MRRMGLCESETGPNGGAGRSLAAGTGAAIVDETPAQTFETLAVAGTTAENAARLVFWDRLVRLGELAPQVGFEPTTLRLTAGCSTLELLRNGRAATTNYTEPSGRVSNPGS